MWKCPKCKRSFKNTSQAHSCRTFQLEKHFEDKDYAKELYTDLINKLKKCISFKIESVPCCIHLVTNTIFSAVWPTKEGIQLDFKLQKEIKNPRITKMIKLSKNAYMHYTTIKNKTELDNELINWIVNAYKNSKNN